ncbi:YaaC family protein [Brucella sp. TWI559]
MANEEIRFGHKPLVPRRAIVSPAWNDEKVLTSDIWTYVDLWLRRNAKNTDASFYWEQAKEFYKASLGLPITASPLTLYYCFLNSTKALLSAKNITFTDWHGLTGMSLKDKASLSNEQISLRGSGVLPSLIAYYGEAAPLDTYSLKNMLRNMAFVQRAYCLSYTEPDLFFPLAECRYVKAIGSTEAWFAADLEDRYDDDRILPTLPPGYERDAGFEEPVIRKKKRFRWKPGKSEKENNLKRLTQYQKGLRRDLTYIAGAGKWYLKRRISTATIIDRHATTLIFASMHRLSELSRYDPLRLSRLLDGQRNWLIAEFIKAAPIHFLDEVACEITGQEIDVSGIYFGNVLNL